MYYMLEYVTCTDVDMHSYVHNISTDVPENDQAGRNVLKNNKTEL